MTYTGLTATGTRNSTKKYLSLKQTNTAPRKADDWRHLLTPGNMPSSKTCDPPSRMYLMYIFNELELELLTLDIQDNIVCLTMMKFCCFLNIFLFEYLTNFSGMFFEKYIPQPLRELKVKSYVETYPPPPHPSPRKKKPKHTIQLKSKTPNSESLISDRFG